MRVRTLVVDDSASCAGIIKRTLESIPGVEVIGRCSNGRDALQKIQADAPDLVTLDIEMPGMNGLEVLRALRRLTAPSTVIVLSAAGGRSRELTLRALELGALDFIGKPESAGDDLAVLRERLAPLVSAVAHRKEVRALLRGVAELPAAPVARVIPKPPRPTEPSPDDTAARMRRLAGKIRASMVLIGVSTGGPEALARLVPQLPANLGVPVLIVQHMPPLFTENLAESLNARSSLEVHQARDGQVAMAGHVYIAPGGKQLKVVTGLRQEILMRVTDDAPEHNCRPSVDYLFRSAAVTFPGRSVAVILTGMGCDGTLGLRLLKTGGSITIAQDEASCAVFGMPREAIRAGVVDMVVPLDAIAAAIAKAVH